MTKQSKRKTFPTIFAIAMDYLPIQASAVPCEQVFSSSAETDTKKQNHISPTLMEALQMLKYDYKKSHLTFTEGTKLHQHDLLDDEPEELDCDSGGALVLHQEEAVDTLTESASQEEGNQLQADIILVDF
ncbi:hypothetical protein PISMIDRAFT_17949 [Pisolithus microcarpus 441]|uniref:HAT C-terminal dimerisation domain-containing protein n=1 Tax=Pisolithus microcarpus 441 TaxID=765257 RepID=A0A0C9Y9B0_9AGAM|nr:hypothetical protein PISMIDRAFT_17949 [Pisolithus microcarpus 441]